jgi:16S rRNA (uracil1498-N3)-methyltransferase
MVGSGGAAGAKAARRLFLVPESAHTKPELLEGEADHALRVLRLGPGDSVDGMDGAGGLWPLQVRSVARRTVELVQAGEPRFEPRAGEPGSSLPWIECAVALPRGERAEEMADRLTQLGAAALSPLDAARGTPQSRSHGELRRDRCLRIMRAACKQSGRLWMPLLRSLRTADEILNDASPRSVLVLSPRATTRITDWLRRVPPSHAEAWTASRPLLLVVGPEGGFTDVEHQVFDTTGATFVTLGPHTLRVETAAEAGIAVLVEALHAPRGAQAMRD